MDTSEEKRDKATLEGAQAVANSATEIARTVRNLDTTIKKANEAAKGIKIAGIAVSGALVFLTVVQIILRFAGD